MPKKIIGIELYTLKELTELLSLSTVTLRLYLKNGKLKGQKIGRRWLVSKDNLVSFLEGKSGKKRNKK